MLSYFTDPILRSSTIGSMLMCLASSLIGVLIFVRRRVLIGETLSHAAYPGVVLGAMVSAFFFLTKHDFSLILFVIAFVFVMLALFCIEFLENRLKVKSDAALCFVLAGFFGIGVLLTSIIQRSHGGLIKQVQLFLYGQAATLRDEHVQIYAFLALVVLLILYFTYRTVQVATFDRDFAKTLGFSLSVFDTLLFCFLAIAILIGMRTVGVILMSGMLIAPAISARQMSRSLTQMFFWAAFFGVISAFLGNFLSVEIGQVLRERYPQARLSLPTGPMILLSAGFFCFLTLLFSKDGGVVYRWIRRLSFRRKCLSENILKFFWKKGSERSISYAEVSHQMKEVPSWILRYNLWQLSKQGWLNKTSSTSFMLTKDGIIKAEQIVRFHRLWEVYLVDYLGQGVERVHVDAERMEHIITPEVEKELVELLGDPKRDPHMQPIPPRGTLG